MNSSRVFVQQSQGAAVVSAAGAWSVSCTVEAWCALQMRQDLLGEYFQMLQVVKHRIQE